jgi:uncharacterized protein (TIGR02246 family)
MLQRLRTTLAAIWIFACPCFPTIRANGQDAAESSSEQTDEVAQIEAASQSYTKAFNDRDIEGLVAHWSPEGVYISRNSGERVVGRTSLAKEFETMFAAEGVPTLDTASESVDFISPNVALERGTATVIFPSREISETRYRVVYIKREGKWLIDRVTEEAIVTPPSNYEKLKGLEWLIGNWIDETEGLVVEFDCSWTKNQNFLSRTYKVLEGPETTSSGLQIIGWDAKQEQIRSWLFDSNGAFVAGTWHQNDDGWTVQSVATLPDGGSGSFTSVFRPLEDGSYAWHKINRVLDGRLLPNMDEVVIRRKTPSGGLDGPASHDN